VGWFGLLVWLERRTALRPNVEPRLKRNVRNLAVAGVGALALQLAQKPIVGPLAKVVKRRSWGLVGNLPFPGWLRGAMAVVAMDYTLYLWHVCNHRLPFLWRFHRVHHVDLDLDTSTALRFHFGELTLSVPFRVLQIIIIGTTPAALSVWQSLLFFSILFHHSNVRLPARWDRRIGWFVATPRLHAIHHSIVPAEVNSNWTSGLTVWDRLHGTFRSGAGAGLVNIGVAGCLDPERLTLSNLLTMPFRESGADDAALDKLHA